MFKRVLCGIALLASISTAADAATFTPLGDLTGGSVSSEVFGVSADGSVVAGRSSSASGPQAYRWTGGVMTGL